MAPRFKQQCFIKNSGLDKLNVYNDPEPRGDGFFDFIPGITVDQKYEE